MFTIEPQVTVVKTGSFANWITAAAAVGTFVVVAKTAKKIVEVLTSEKKEEQSRMAYARQDVADTASIFEKNKQVLRDFASGKSDEYLKTDRYQTYAKQFLSGMDEEPVIHPKPQPRAKVVQNMINLRDKAIRSVGKKVTRTLLKSALNQSLK